MKSNIIGSIEVSTSGKPLLFIPIETKVREYHGKLLLSLIAAENGFRVILGGQRDIRKIVHRYGQGIYLDKSIAATKKKWMKWCRRIGLTVSGWDEEGLVYFDDETYHELRLCESVLQDMPLFFTWGEAQRETIIAKVPEACNKLVPIGNPRVDMMRPEVRQFYGPAADRLKEKYGKIILINTNFGLSNHFHGVEAERKRLEVYPIARRIPGFFEGWLEAQSKVMEHYRVMIPHIRHAFPDYTIIVRPHPSENHETWKSVTRDLDRCYVTGEGNVLEWILASEVLVHFNCTTAIEAYLLGVAAVAFHPEDIGKYEQKLPKAMSMEAQNLDELSQLVSSVLAGEINGFFLNEDPERTARVKHSLGALDGELSSERIVQCLKDSSLLARKKRSVSEQLNRITRAGWLIANGVKERARGIDTYHSQKFPGLAFEEVADDVDRFRRTVGRFSKVTVSPAPKGCFQLEVS